MIVRMKLRCCESGYGTTAVVRYEEGKWGARLMEDQCGACGKVWTDHERFLMESAAIDHMLLEESLDQEELGE